MIPVIYAAGAQEFYVSTPDGPFDTFTDISVSVPDGIESGDGFLIVTIGTKYSADSFEWYQTTPTSGGPIFYDEGESTFQVTVFSGIVSDEPEILFSIPNVYHSLVGTILRVEGLGNISGAGGELNDSDELDITLPAVTQPFDDADSICVRLIAADTRFSGTFDGFPTVVDLVSPVEAAPMRVILGVSDSAEGPVIYPPLTVDLSLSGGTVWVGSSLVFQGIISVITTDNCAPLRFRQRDDKLETPRMRAGTRNPPTSVGFSFRRGWQNTYDGPGDCVGGGTAG